MPQSKVSSRLSKAAACPVSDEDHDALDPSKETMSDVRKLLEQYIKEVSTSVELSQYSKSMYIDFANCFVRWVHGEFKPGSRGHDERRKQINKVWPRRPFE
jgi:hypothetical protein